MSTESYQEYRDRIATEQEGMSKEEIVNTLKAEYVLDLDNLGTQDHVWVDRGAIVVCEGAMHATHRHWKRGKS